MPTLADYLGHLISEVTRARVQADLESVRIAELYASHPLLKHMPVPRFRVPEITLDVPVAIKKSSPNGKPPMKAEDVRNSFEAVLHKFIEEKHLSLTPQQSLTLKKQLEVDLERVSPALVSGTRHAAAELAKTATGWMARAFPVDAARITGMTAELQERASRELLKLQKAPEGLEVLVTAQELKEAGREQLAVFRLSISEDSYEWAFIDDQDGVKERLVPE